MSDYAVNSKEPIAAWIPSRDTAGNGTTTLTDLVGSNTGTLTNFAMTGSTSNWVADTDSGGVRALDHDGTNDYVAMSSSTFFPSGNFGLSWWEKINTAGSFNAVAAFRLDATSVLLIYRATFINYTYLAWRKSTSVSTAGFRATNASNPSSVTGQWRHFVLTGSSAASSTVSDFTAYENGSSLTLAASGPFQSSTFINSIGRDGLGTFNAFRFDDGRIFDQTLDANDVAYLYNSGLGRGRIPVTGNSRRRRQSVSGGVL